MALRLNVFFSVIRRSQIVGGWTVKMIAANQSYYTDSSGGAQLWKQKEHCAGSLSHRALFIDESLWKMNDVHLNNSTTHRNIEQYSIANLYIP